MEKLLLLFAFTLIAFSKETSVDQSNKIALYKNIIHLKSQSELDTINKRTPIESGIIVYGDPYNCIEVTSDCQTLMNTISATLFTYNFAMQSKVFFVPINFDGPHYVLHYRFGHIFQKYLTAPQITQNLKFDYIIAQ